MEKSAAWGLPGLKLEDEGFQSDSDQTNLHSCRLSHLHGAQDQTPASHFTMQPVYFFLFPPLPDGFPLMFLDAPGRRCSITPLQPLHGNMPIRCAFCIVCIVEAIMQCYGKKKSIARRSSPLVGGQGWSALSQGILLHAGACSASSPPTSAWRKFRPLGFSRKRSETFMGTRNWVSRSECASCRKKFTRMKPCMGFWQCDQFMAAMPSPSPISSSMMTRSFGAQLSLAQLADI